MFIVKCQGWAILLGYKQNSFYSLASQKSLKLIGNKNHFTISSNSLKVSFTLLLWFLYIKIKTLAWVYLRGGNMATGVGDLDLEGAITLQLCCHRGSHRQTGSITDIVRRNQVIAQASTNTLKNYINKIFDQICFFINILQFKGYLNRTVFSILYRK